MPCKAPPASPPLATGTQRQQGRRSDPAPVFTCALTTRPLLSPSSQTLAFRRLSEALPSPGDLLLSDFAKMDRPGLLHIAFQALDAFQVGGPPAMQLAAASLGLLPGLPGRERACQLQCPVWHLSGMQACGRPPPPGGGGGAAERERERERWVRFPVLACISLD